MAIANNHEEGGCTAGSVTEEPEQKIRASLSISLYPVSVKSDIGNKDVGVVRCVTSATGMT